MSIAPSRFVEDPAPAAACCTGKERFDTPQRAYSVLRARKINSRELYRCPHCGGFHLGRKK